MISIYRDICAAIFREEIDHQALTKALARLKAAEGTSERMTCPFDEAPIEMERKVRGKCSSCECRSPWFRYEEDKGSAEAEALVIEWFRRRP